MAEQKEAALDEGNAMTMDKSNALQVLRAELARVDDELGEVRRNAATKGRSQKAAREEKDGYGEDFEDEEDAGDEAYANDEEFDEEEKHENKGLLEINETTRISKRQAPKRTKSPANKPSKPETSVNSVKSRILQGQQSLSSKERTKLKGIAMSMSASDIRSMVEKSTIVRQAMLNIGVLLGDLVPGGNEARFKNEMSAELKRQLEFRRQETLVQVIAERHRLVEKLEGSKQNQEEKQAPQSPVQLFGPKGNTISILSQAEQREIFEKKLEERRVKDAERDAKAAKLRQWHHELETKAHEHQRKLHEDVKVHLERASAQKDKTKDKTQKQIREREARQARKMEICEAIKNRRHRAMALRSKETQERLRVLAETKDPLKAAAAGNGGKLSRTATLKLQALQERDQHRREVRIASQKLSNLKKRELRLEQHAKQARLTGIKEKMGEEAQRARERRAATEVDRMLKMERLQRQQDHEKAQAQLRINRKVAFAESLDQMQAELTRMREQARRDDFARAVARDQAHVKSMQVLPGPGEYDVGGTLNSVGGKIGLFDIAKVKAAEERASAASPGPGAYEAF